jgi:hypothetical protein
MTCLSVSTLQTRIERQITIYSFKNKLNSYLKSSHQNHVYCPCENDRDKAFEENRDRMPLIPYIVLDRGRSVRLIRVIIHVT